jgi:hypothetical protein
VAQALFAAGGFHVDQGGAVALVAHEHGQALARSLIGFFLERLAFDLELNDAPLEPVHDLGLGIDLHADARGRLVE